MFTLRDASAQAWKQAQAGDSAGYRSSIAKIREYVRSVYPPSDLDKGWKEWASAQLSIGDRNGSAATAQMIHAPALRVQVLVETASKYHDSAAFADAVRVGLECPSPEDAVDALQNVARLQYRAGSTADAQATLRKAPEHFARPYRDRRSEEKRAYSLKKVIVDQIQYNDIPGAKSTARVIPDPEYMARVAVAQYKAGDAAGSGATFQEAIRLAQKATGDWQPYYLERITYSLLECGMLPAAQLIARSIPTGANLSGGHREKAISQVVFALADRGDIAGAKKMADAHLSRQYCVISSLRIAADQRQTGGAKGALKTITDARQRIIAFPGGKGALNEDKVNCLNRLAFVQYLWNDPAQGRETIAWSFRLANQVPDELPRLDNIKDTIGMQAMCGESPAALTAAASKMPEPFQREAMEAIQRAGENRKSLLSNLQFECLDLRQTRRP